MSENSYEALYNKIYSKLLTRGSERGIKYSTDPSSLVAETVRIAATNMEAAIYAISAAIREGNNLTARKKNSILNNARFFGVRLKRKSSKTCTVHIVNPEKDSIIINSFENFVTSAGTNLYYFSSSNQAVSIPGGSSIDITLYEGTVKEQTFVLKEFGQVFTVESEEAWAIDDSNVTIINNTTGEVYSVTSDPVFVLKLTDLKASNDTNAYGMMTLSFGIPPVAYSPALGSVLRVIYAETSGYNFSGSLEVGESITSAEHPTLQITASSGLIGGSNELPTQYYQRHAHALAKAYNNANSSDEFEALLLYKYGDLIRDCKVYGQAAVAPLSKSYMNTISVMLMEKEGVTISDSVWQEMVDYLKDNSSEFWHFTRLFPEKIDVVISCELMLNNISIPGSVDLTKEIKNSLLSLVNSTRAEDFMSTRVLTKYSVQSTIESTVKRLINNSNPIANLRVTEPYADITIDLNRYFNLSEDNITVNISFKG